MSSEIIERLARMETTIGSIKDGQDRLVDKMDGHNARLYEVEHASKVNAMKAGGLMGIGTGILVALMKEKLGLGG